MFVSKQLIRSCRLVSSIGQPAAKSIGDSAKLIQKDFVTIRFGQTRRMAQKAITSFFKFIPQKTESDRDKAVSPSVSQDKHKTSPISNETEKKSSKRQRIDSSENECQSPKKKSGEPSSPPEAPSKKRITKRQRIESSGSESENLQETRTVVKLETASPKTYSSSKSKKTPAKLKTSPLKVNDNNVGKGKRKSPSPAAKNPKIEKGTTSKNKNEEKINNVDNNIDKKEENEEVFTKVPQQEYNPSKSKYHPIKDACWSEGEEVPYLALAKTFEVIETTSARLKMIEILSNYFRSVMVLTPEDLLPSIYMCLNQLAPAYHSLELGIAETYLMKAVGQCTGRTLAQVRAAAARLGDLGAAAEQARAAQRTMFAAPQLRVRRVFAALKDIARITGQASVNKKIAKIQSLYVACRFCEAKYLIRSLEGKLRIGLAEQSVLQALAQASAATPPGPGARVLDASRGLTPEQFKARVDETALLIKTTYCECPDYDRLVAVLLRHGPGALPAHCRLAPGVPLKPMLAHPTRSVRELFDRFESEQFTCEWKYDGERAQLHVPAVRGRGVRRAGGEGGADPTNRETGQASEADKGSFGQASEAGEGSVDQPSKAGEGSVSQASKAGEKSAGQASEAGEGSVGQASEVGKGSVGQGSEAVNGQASEVGEGNVAQASEAGKGSVGQASETVKGQASEAGEGSVAQASEAGKGSVGQASEAVKGQASEAGEGSVDQPSEEGEECEEIELRPDLARASVFSRNQENNTSKYPDIIGRLPAFLKESVTSCVLDCEAVAYDVATKQILPFQVLSTRKRKDAAVGDISVQVCVFAFDLLYLNGRPLVREPLEERRRLLREHFHTVPGQWELATSQDCSSVEEVQQFLEEAVRGSCEGLMVKLLRGPNARYDIARRSHNWLKLKKDYLEGAGDTLDLVVIGAYSGRGRRAGAWGGFLLACRDPHADEFQALCRLGTGFSDQDLQTLAADLQEHIIDAPKSYYRYDESHAPDAWVAAARVWEVRCADLSLSPAHRAAIGLVDPERGVSLRFPRFVRVRDDKTPEQATTAQQIAEMYLAQDQVKNNAAVTKLTNLDDFY